MERATVQVVSKGDIEIRVIRERCISAGTCAVYAEKTFDIDEGGIAVIRNQDWDGLEKIIAAAESCPVLAIEVYQKGVKLFSN
ncbi:ferredoxin [Candidatus Peregrinibacteria bacterium]|nr:ferredoxin [Candidatus Peregrinibacteria bacterium]